ncbi:hypothetical protein DFH09DRAFT_1121868 [Mycena vulgaris]|nr:hypothetical protein DFH09DRAFT_1121868 [Mycena vulgaris]
MASFAEKVTKAFPGLFDKGYLEKSGKMSTSSKKKSRTSKPAEALAPLSPPPSPPKYAIIKVPRQPPKSALRKTATTTVDEPMPDAPSPGTVPLDRVPSRRTRSTTIVDEPMPDAPPLETGATTHDPPPNPTDTEKLHTAAPTPEKEDVPVTLEEFLAECWPSMRHCAPAFLAAGVREVGDLRWMARWGEQKLRNFLTARNIARTPLEVEAIFISISVCLSSSPSSDSDSFVRPSCKPIGYRLFVGENSLDVSSARGLFVNLSHRDFAMFSDVFVFTILLCFYTFEISNAIAASSKLEAVLVPFPLIQGKEKAGPERLRLNLRFTPKAKT